MGYMDTADAYYDYDLYMSRRYGRNWDDGDDYDDEDDDPEDWGEEEGD